MKRTPLKRKARLGTKRGVPWLRGATIDSRLNGHPSARERFEAAVVRGPNCWDWTGATVRGYGQLVVMGVKTYAHRFSYELAHGAISADLEILHTCDNPPCCNPEHLVLGTHKQNMEDAARKGRMPGSVLGTKKLAVADYEEIKNSVESTMALSLRYGVDRSLIRRIRKRGDSAYRNRSRSTDFMLWVKQQPCAMQMVPITWPTSKVVSDEGTAVSYYTWCSGPIEADHMGERGLSRKAADSTCAPLCNGHHHERTNHCGIFTLAVKAQLRDWRAAVLAWVADLWERELARRRWLSQSTTST